MKTHKSGPKKATEIITEKICDHGCGQQAKFLNLSGKYLCASTTQQCPSVKARNSAGGQKSYSDGKRLPMTNVYAQLPQEIKDKMNWNKGKFTGTSFEYNGKGNHKGLLVQERGHRCECCGLAEWLNRPITLELEHIDGDNRNNEKENLKLLCPNCHSLTDTWRGRNINSGKLKVTDEQLIDALSKSTSIHKALSLVGLTPKGGNYVRCNNLIHGGVVKLATTSDLSSDASA